MKIKLLLVVFFAGIVFLSPSFASANYFATRTVTFCGNCCVMMPVGCVCSSLCGSRMALGRTYSYSCPLGGSLEFLPCPTCFEPRLECVTCVPSWTPAVSSVCAGQSFTQTNQCDSTTRTTVGTGLGGSYLPDVNTKCLGQSFLQSNTCSSQTATGTSASACAPTLSFSATPNPVSNNSAASLSWTTGNAASCTASGDWLGSKAATGGSESTGNLTGAKTYSLECLNATNVSSGVKTVNVNVNACVPNYSGYSCSLVSTGNVCDQTNAGTTIISKTASCNASIADSCGLILSKQACIDAGKPCADETTPCPSSNGIEIKEWKEVQP